MARQPTFAVHISLTLSLKNVYSDLAERLLMCCSSAYTDYTLFPIKSNTAYIERLNATFRERLAPLARRCRALARHTLTLHEGMFVVGTVYNFCTPHESLSHTQQTTPAMAAGITDHCWTMHELLSFHVPLSRWSPPKQRGRPSRALLRLIERWC